MPSLYHFRLKFYLYFTKNEKLPGDQLKNNEVGAVCGMFGRQESCMQGFGWVT